MSHHVYSAYADVQRRLKSNEVVIVDDISMIDNLPHTSLYEVLIPLAEQSIYQVGYRMGEILVNLRKLLPEVRLGGAELSNLYSEYAEKLFNLLANNIFTETIDFRYKANKVKSDIVFAESIFNACTPDDKLKILKNMALSTTKYILVKDINISQNDIEYVNSLGFTHQEMDDDIILWTKKEELNDRPTK